MTPPASGALGTLSAPLFGLPLLAAVLFSFSALLFKRSAHWKIDVWRTTFITNFCTAFAFIPLLGFGGQIPSWGLIWQPALVALLFLLGQATTVIALTRGDVSVSAPVLGLKILFVALFSWMLIGRPLPGNLWVACAMATVGVMLLNAGGSGVARRHVALSFASAGTAALSFALFDVCVQVWAPAWGVGRFLPIMLGLAAILSLSFTRRFDAPLTAIPAAAWPWLGGGAALIGIQSTIFVVTVATWGQAAAANVVYCTRGVWTVLLVATVGRVLSIHDAGLRGRVLGLRLAGAAMVLAAIAVLALFEQT